MSRFARTFAALLLSIPAAYVAAAGWWRAWMYHGWFGPPRFLHPYWPQPVDGEASYDATFAEMFVIAVVLSFLLHLLFWWLRSQWFGNRSYRDAA